MRSDKVKQVAHGWSATARASSNYNLYNWGRGWNHLGELAPGTDGGAEEILAKKTQDEREELHSMLLTFHGWILAHFDFTLPQAIYDLHLWLMITLCNLTACPCLERSEALALDTGAVATRWRVWGLQDNRRWCSACTECSYTSPSANNLTDKWTFF